MHQQPPAVSVLRTNKPVYAEAISILYGDNVISLPYSPEYMQRFFQAIDAGNQSRLARVVVHGYHVANYFDSDRVLPTHPISMIVENCPNLKELVFQSHYFGEPGRRRTFMELHSHLANLSSLERVVIQLSRRSYRMYKAPPKYPIELECCRAAEGKKTTWLGLGGHETVSVSHPF